MNDVVGAEEGSALGIGAGAIPTEEGESISSGLCGPREAVGVVGLDGQVSVHTGLGIRRRWTPDER